MTHPEFISTIDKLQWFIQKIYLHLPLEVVSRVNLFLYVLIQIDFIISLPTLHHLKFINGF
jgi:hypothetical protein